RRQVLQPRTFDLNDVVRGIEAMLRRLIGEDIDLVLDLEQAIGLVRADPNQIEQVILNLAVNARDALPAGGRLLIKTYTEELHGVLAASVGGPARGGTERVLVVEDEHSLRALMRETLRRYGYEVVDAGSAAEALAAATLVEPDILVTDIVMPATGGHELAAR